MQLAKTRLGTLMVVGGATLLVGGLNEARAQCVATELVWLHSSDPAYGDWFGRSVAISGDIAVIGAYLDDDDGPGSGSAYVFERSAGGLRKWRQVAKLTAADAAAIDQFGYSVAISGGTAVIGAPLDDNENGEDAGSAYVFYRNPGGSENWVQVKQLLADDGYRWDYFGRSVAISGDIMVIGSPGDDDSGGQSGSAYVFYRNAGGTDNWSYVKKLTDPNGAPYDYFGFDVAISGDIIVIGAPGDDDPSDSGAAYVFQRNAGGTDNWGQVRKRKANNAAGGDQFGWAAAISGDTAVIGAWRHDDPNDPNNCGSAYVLERNEGGADNWGQLAELTANDGAASDYFGFDVGVSGDIAVVGAYKDDDHGSDSGSAYVFKKPSGGWANMTQSAKLLHSVGEREDLFGFSVAISGSTALIAAPADNHYGGDAGSTFVFGGLSDCNKNDSLDLCDIVDCPPGEPSCADCNKNGMPDACDIADGTSQDCNANGVPTECEPDFDVDGDVDLDDYGQFAACYNGSARPPAAACPQGVDADLDCDGDVDLDDFGIFAANYTGAL